VTLLSRYKYIVTDLKGDCCFHYIRVTTVTFNMMVAVHDILGTTVTKVRGTDRKNDGGFHDILVTKVTLVSGYKNIVKIMKKKSNNRIYEFHKINDISKWVLNVASIIIT